MRCFLFKDLKIERKDYNDITSKAEQIFKDKSARNADSYRGFVAYCYCTAFTEYLLSKGWNISHDSATSSVQTEETQS